MSAFSPDFSVPTEVHCCSIFRDKMNVDTFIFVKPATSKMYTITWNLYRMNKIRQVEWVVGVGDGAIVDGETVGCVGIWQWKLDRFGMSLKREINERIMNQLRSRRDQRLTKPQSNDHDRAHLLSPVWRRTCSIRCE